MKLLFCFVGLILKGIWKVIIFIRLVLINFIFLFSIGIIYFIYVYVDVLLFIMDKFLVLVFNLFGLIVEQSMYINLMDFFMGFVFGEEFFCENVLFDIVEILCYVKNDNNVIGFVLVLGDMLEINLIKLCYIVKVINEFKVFGKFVFVVGDFYNQS